MNKPNTSSRPELARKVRERSSSGKKLSFPTKPLPYSMLFTFNKYNYTNLFNSVKALTGEDIGGSTKPAAQIESTDVIELPFPSNLSDITSLRVDNFGRSAIVEKAAEALGAASGADDSESLLTKLKAMADAAAGSVQDSTAALVSKDSRGRGDLAAFLSYMTTVFGQNKFSSSVNSAIGRVVNPKETLGFNGVDLKAYSFSWKLYPSNRRDSDVIRDIIAAIKRNVLPATRNFSGAETLFLAYPSTVDIELIGVDTSYFFEFQTSMVSAFNVTYGNGENVPLLKGGKPASVTIDIEFSELSARNAGDYDEIYPADETASVKDTGGN